MSTKRSLIFDTILQKDINGVLNSKTFVSDIDEPITNKCGTLFGFLYLPASSKSSLSLDAISDSLQNYFYTTALIQADFLSWADLEHQFEQALAQINKEYASIIKTIDAHTKKYLIGCVALLKDTNLLIAPIGSVKGFIVRAQTPTTKKDTSPILDNFAFHEFMQNDTPLQNKHLFSSLSSGTLQKQDLVFFCPTQLVRLLSEEKLKEQLLTHHPQELPEIFQKTLADTLYDQIPYILIHAQEAFQPITRTLPPVEDTSMEQLTQTVQKTRSFIFPSFLISLIQAWNKWFKPIKPWGKDKPRFKRKSISLIVAPVLITAAITVLVWSFTSDTTSKPSSAQNDNAVQSAIASTEQILAQAQASFIYKDEEKTRQLLQQANQALQQEFIKKHPSFERMNDTYQQLFNEVYHITIKNDKQTIYTFGSETPIEGISLSGSHVLAFSCHQAQLKKPDNDQPTMFTTEDSFCIKAARALPDGFLLISTNNQFALIELNSASITPLPLSFPMTVTDAQFFNNSVYILDAAKSAIYKSKYAGKKLAEPTTWLQRPVDLSSATSFTIDGSLYITQQSGEIIRLFMGKQKTDITYNNSFIPPLTKPFKIVGASVPQQDALYVLDQEQKRLLTWSKTTGSSQTQYQFPFASSMNDIAFDENTTQLYILDGSTVYAIKLN